MTVYVVGLVAVVGLAYAAVAIHEAAHGLAAWATGNRPTVVTIGVGPRLLATRLGPIDVAVHAVPAGGATRQPVPTGRFATARHVAFVAAGPLASLAVAGVCLLGRPVGAASAWFGYVNLAVGVLALVPLPADDSAPGSDGSQLLDELLGRSMAGHDRAAWTLARQAEAHTRAGDHGAAIDLLDDAIDLTTGEHPSWRALRASLLLASDDADRRVFALDEARAVLGADPLPLALRPRLANALAFELVAGDDPAAGEAADEAEQWARLAVDLDGSPLAQDTLALVLVRQGHYADAAELAQRAHAAGSTSTPATRASMCCTAALAALGLGDHHTAERLAAEARRLDPAAVLLPEVHRRLQDG